MTSEGEPCILQVLIQQPTGQQCSQRQSGPAAGYHWWYQVMLAKAKPLPLTPPFPPAAVSIFTGALTLISREAWTRDMMGQNPKGRRWRLELIQSDTSWLEKFSCILQNVSQVTSDFQPTMNHPHKSASSCPCMTLSRCSWSADVCPKRS